MNIIWIGPTILLAIIFSLIFCLVMAIGKMKDLERAKQNLKDDNSKLSNALREKGIEVDQLNKKIKRLEEGK